MKHDKRPACAFCRRRPGDAFIHYDLNANAYHCGLYDVICFDCIELMFDRENAAREHGNGRDGLFRVFAEQGNQIGVIDLNESLPNIWDKPPRPIKRPTRPAKGVAQHDD